MIRVGARAPQPPPLPSSPSTSKPRHSRQAEQYKERVLNRIRLAGNLREKVVQLACRKEERLEQGDDAARVRSAERSPNHTQTTTQGGETHQAKEVAVLVLDLKTGRTRTNIVPVGSSPRTERVQTISSGQTGWERAALNESKADGNHSIESQPGQRLPTEHQRPPDSPPFPRSSAHRFQSLQLSPASKTSTHNQTSSRQNHDVHSPSSIPRQQNPEGYHRQDQRHQSQTKKVAIVTKTAPAARTTSATTSPMTNGKTVRTPSNSLVNRRSSDVQESSSARTSPRSQDRPKESPPETPRQNNSGSVSRQTHPIDVSSMSRDHPGQGLYYKKAGRAVYAKHAPSPPVTEPQKRVSSTFGQDRHRFRRNVSFRSEERASYHQSSVGSSGDSPRQMSRGEEVGEVRGNAVPSSPHQRLHTPHSSHRMDSKNPSSFASSLEMFKRRLKMNQARFTTKEGGAEEEDYVIRLGDTITVSSRLGTSQQVRKPRSPDNPMPTPTSSSPSPPQKRRNQARVADKIEDHHLYHPHDLTKRCAGIQDHHPDKASEKDVTNAADNLDNLLGERTDGDGQEASLDGADLDDKDCTASCRMPESADDLTYVPLDMERTPLPQVKTYVVEGDVTKLLQGRAQGLPMALTQHNVKMHDIFLQRRTEREQTRLRRAEMDRKTRGRGDGGGGTWKGHVRDNSDPQESRMRRWLIDTEIHHTELQPMINFKIAVPPV